MPTCLLLGLPFLVLEPAFPPQQSVLETLSAPEVEHLTTGVTSFKPSPDGRWVAYSTGDFPNELYAVATDLPLQARINEPGQHVSSYEIAPGGAHIAFLVTTTLSAPFELFTSSGSGPAVRVSPPLGPGGSVSPLFPAITFVGNRILFRAYLAVGQPQHLYVVPADASTPALDLTPLAHGVVRIQADPSGNQVYFVGAQDTPGVNEVYVVPLDGSAAPVRLSGALPPSGNVLDFGVAPGGGRLVYLADALTDGQFELFSISTAPGSTPVRLNAALASSWDVNSFQLTSDGARVVFLTARGSTAELWSAPSDGSAPAVLLHGSAALSAFRIAPDDSRVAFLGAQAPQLRSVAVDGSASAIAIGTGVVGVQRFEFSTDSTRIVFTGSQAGAAQILLSVPVDGSSPPLVLDASGPVDSLRISGPEATYRVEMPNRLKGLYSTLVDGSAPRTRLGPAPGLVPGGSVSSFVVNRSGRVFFGGDFGHSGFDEVFVVPQDASLPARVVNAPLPTTITLGRVTGFALSADGQRVAYGLVATPPLSSGPLCRYRTLRLRDGGVSTPLDAGLTGRFATSPPVLPGQELAFAPDGERAYFASFLVGQDVFGNRADGAGTPEWLSPGAFSTQDFTQEILVAPDGRSLAATVVTDDQGYGGSSVRLLATDARWAPVSLSQGGGAGTEVSGLAFTPDSGHLLAQLGYTGEQGLYALPTDGSAPVLLSPTATGVGDFRIVDATQVLFTWSGALHHTSLSGPATPLTSSGVGWWELGADHSRVLWSSGTTVQSMPVDGSQPALLLLDDFASGGETMRFEKFLLPTPDGTRVLFTARGLTSGQRRAFAVATDGSLSTTPVTPLLPSGGSFVRLLLSPDGSHLVYLATTATSGSVELHATPLAGGPAVRLSRPFATHVNDDVVRFHPDGMQVLFLQAPVLFQREVLWIARLDGGSTRSVSGTIPAQDDFVVAPDGRWVYFRGARDPVRTELFRASLAPYARRSR